MGCMDRAGMADFLRRRREALQPADVGLARGPRRRTAGLRREEVAALSGMSPDYYSRMEQQRGPQPSEQMIAAIARGLRLSLDERDHLFRLAGHSAPSRVLRTDFVSPAMLRVLDRLGDTPALVMSDLGQTLAHNALGEALLGDHLGHTGHARSSYYRWFTDPAARRVYPVSDHGQHSRIFASALRTAVTRGGTDPSAAEMVAELNRVSPEFAQLWDRHEVGVRHQRQKTIVHAELGEIDVDCQVLHTENLAQSLLVFTATPGTASYDKLELLAVVGRSLTT